MHRRRVESHEGRSALRPTVATKHPGEGGGLFLSLKGGVGTASARESRDLRSTFARGKFKGQVVKRSRQKHQAFRRDTRKKNRPDVLPLRDYSGVLSVGGGGYNQSRQRGK